MMPRIFSALPLWALRLLAYPCRLAADTQAKRLHLAVREADTDIRK